MTTPKMIAMSKDGEDAIWLWGTPSEGTAVIAPKKPTTDDGARPLMALMSHLMLDEWNWFEPK